MGEPSLTELYLAWRQAKVALYYERRGVGLVELAQFERGLPQHLAAIQKKLSADCWFDDLSIGEVWIVPKRLEMVSEQDGVVRLGTPAKGDPPLLDVQVRLSPSPEFAVVELLYLRQFGPALDRVLSDNSVGYRLDLRQGKVDATRRWVFEYWPRRYQEFRSAPLNLARAALARSSGPVVIVSADLAAFYDSIDPAFLLSAEFLARLRASGMTDSAPYEVATSSLLGAFQRFRDKASSRLGLPLATGVPIGSLTSRVLANVALSTLDEYIESRPGLLAYRRYVDDLVIVAPLR